jgi:hypothetical protein
MKTEAALARSSEEVSRALDLFLKERSDASEAQDRAFKLYEAEMLHISAEGDEEERIAMYVCLSKSLASNSFSERENSRSVDHNLMRLINSTGEESFDFPDESVDQSISVSGPSTSQSMTRSLLSDDAPRNLVKRQPPSDLEKTALREQMFDFFDSARDVESEMVSSRTEPPLHLT